MKIIALLLPLIFLCWTGRPCSAHPQVVGFLIPVSGLGDQSFNDMTYAGLVKAKNIYDFELVREQCEGTGSEGRREAMDRLIAREAAIIVTNGWEFIETIREYAARYPDRYFIVNDYPLDGLPNVISTVFGQHEGSFLAGALAALTSASGEIGFIGGKDMPVIRAFLTGFREGAGYARADIKIHTVFLSGKDEETAGFDNPGLAYAQAGKLYSGNVDIIFSVAGLAGNGIIRAAAQQGKFVIGVDADQDHMARGHVLTSVLKRLDRATFETLRLILEGEFVPGIYTFGLKENGVALSPMTYTRHLISKEVLEKIDDIRARIIAGEIVVTNALEKDI